MLDYNYFKNYYKMIAIHLSKQQELDADPKAIHYTVNQDRDRNLTMFFIIEKRKKPFNKFTC